MVQERQHICWPQQQQALLKPSWYTRLMLLVTCCLLCCLKLCLQGRQLSVRMLLLPLVLLLLLLLIRAVRR